MFRCFSSIRSASGKVGFIGLGNMGGPMAMNLVKKGEMDLVVFDVNQESVDKLASAGATAAAEPAEVAAECDRVVTMLPNSPHVESVYSSLLTTASPGTLFLDCSTIDPAVAQKVRFSQFYMTDIFSLDGAPLCREKNNLHGLPSIWWCWCRNSWYIIFHGRWTK